ncbi:MAG: hypothetical protein ACFFEY_11695 [Candidatus Thorarchaeota archaeon]
MKFYGLLMLFILLLFQTESPAAEVFNFILIFFGIVLLIIILVYVLLTSKQD